MIQNNIEKLYEIIDSYLIAINLEFNQKYYIKANLYYVYLSIDDNYNSVNYSFRIKDNEVVVNKKYNAGYSCSKFKTNIDIYEYLNFEFKKLSKGLLL